MPRSSQSVRDAQTTTVERELNIITRSSTLGMKLNELRLVPKYRDRRQNTKVSVIMPTWNRAFIIRRAIDSVLRQTYANFEIIISDDGSTDETEQLIRDVYPKEERIRFLRNTHSGVSQARNIALKHANGSLVAYLDTDNEWMENYLLLMVNSFADHEDVNTMYCGIRIINNLHRMYYTRLREYDRIELLLRNYIDMNVFMHRRRLFNLLGGFIENVPPLEDWELVLRYTRDNPPFVLRCCLVHYFIEKGLHHQTLNTNINESYRRVRELYNQE